MGEEFCREKSLWVWLKSLQLYRNEERLLLLRADEDIEKLYELICVKDPGLDVLNGEKKSLLLAKACQSEIDRASERLAAQGIGVLLRTERDFPHSMHHVQLPPELLYWRGNRAIFSRQNTLGVVGTREATPYGERITRACVFELAERGICIVSGLARGIDGIAHRAALDGEGDTIAVLAGGLDKVYPLENRELFAKIVEKGLLVSENPPGHPIRNFSAPQRNRLIAALSKALFIPQASIKSGTRYTIDAALDLGLDVYALPGPVDDPMSALPNFLIQNGSRIVLEAKDILESYGGDFSLEEFAGKPEAKPAEIDLTGEEKTVYLILQEEPCSVDDLIMKGKMSVPQLLINLTKLEQKNMIHKEASDNRFYIR